MALLLNVAILLLGLAIFLAIPFGIFFLLAYLGGWRELAGRYRARQPFTGQKIGRQTAWMRGTARYRNCLTFGADAHGLSIAVFPLFRPAHPPLYIPWSEITAARGRRRFVDGVYLRFPNVQEAWIFIKVELAERLVAQGPLQIALASGETTS